MKKPTPRRFFIGSFLILASQLSLLATVGAHTTQSPSKSKLITESSVGSVRLGMTVAEVQRVLPGATLTRTTDGEGLALISVQLRGNALMIFYAGETNPKAPINKAAVIEYVEARSSGYQTAAGVHPKMTLSEVEKRHGALKEIFLSEIEGREYATFANQPAGIHLRVMSANGLAGNYPEGQNKAQSYAPTAYVFGISIWRVPEKARQFSSTYKDTMVSMPS